MRWAELEPGREFLTASRSISAADVAAFADLTGDRNALHDPLAAGESPFGTPVVHGMLVEAIAVGLVSQTGVTGGILLALLEASFAYKAPVRFGDTVQAKLTVAERRPTSSKDKGLVTLAVTVTNQRGEVVQEGRLVELVSTA